ncbi:MAG TPA: alanine--tRNA ligase [Spirochaetes bacterium]|nr:alanine--tRNA ligase [Spirochaetota bacterium]
MLKVRDLRDSFIGFFREREHRIVPSSPLIPKDDPTLLFTTAGMVQFKPMFAGTVKLEYTRAATVQKCLRTSDLERVGKTARHCTFFEMLGNFSFGDYFKKEAIEYAWDYSTGVIGFPREALWVSIYEQDDEAFELWNRHIGVSPDRIVRLGKEDNFWGPAGDSGACGPCSELYLDRGPSFGCGGSDCKPGCDCERFLEYWNLVFNQFFQDNFGTLTPLPRTGIDTGMGLERLATLVQDAETIYGTDELRSLVDFVCREAGVKYEGAAVSSIQVLVEHARALTFSVSDGAYPSNEGRGYVLRRILRRALRFGRQIGIDRPFLYRMVDPIIEIMGPYYPEIAGGAANIKHLLEGEEKRFLETLENGMDRLEEIMKELSRKKEHTIPGKDAFMLYDTFGFPLEMTMEIASENGLGVDETGFHGEMEKQRERGKQSWKASDSGLETIMDGLARLAGETVFKGYDAEAVETTVTALSLLNRAAESLSPGDRGLVVTGATTFYGESGGQVGDSGTIRSRDGAVFRVLDTKKINKTMVHLGEMENGTLKVGDTVSTEIDVVRRNLTRANHTATHLLQSALKTVLGDHVRQSGSLVEPDRLRFDFAHFSQLGKDEIELIESKVNDVIWQSRQVRTEVKPIDEALKEGAIAVFDEKYDETVRVVSVPGVSKELCGGTHVDNTGKIGVFKILREGSPGAGLRRIEAITLKGVLDRLNRQEEIVSALVEGMKTTEHDLVRKTHDLMERSRALEKELERVRKENLSSSIDDVIKDAVTVGETTLVAFEFQSVDIDELRKLSDMVRSKFQNSVTCFGSHVDGKALLLFAATGPAVKKGVDCGALIKGVSGLVGGGGGGRKDMAQAGGKKPDGIAAALKAAVEMARSMLGG